MALHTTLFHVLNSIVFATHHLEDLHHPNLHHLHKQIGILSPKRLSVLSHTHTHTHTTHVILILDGSDKNMLQCHGLLVKSLNWSKCYCP